MQKAIRKVGVIFLGLLMALVFCACAPAGLKNAEKMLKNQGYSVSVTQFDRNSDEYKLNGYKGYLKGTQNVFGWKIEAHHFVSGKIAKEWYEKNAQGKENAVTKDCWVDWGSYVSVHNFVGDI